MVEIAKAKQKIKADYATIIEKIKVGAWIILTIIAIMMTTPTPTIIPVFDFTNILFNNRFKFIITQQYFQYLFILVGFF